MIPEGSIESYGIEDDKISNILVEHDHEGNLSSPAKPVENDAKNGSCSQQHDQRVTQVGFNLTNRITLLQISCALSFLKRLFCLVLFYHIYYKGTVELPANFYLDDFLLAYATCFWI